MDYVYVEREEQVNLLGAQPQRYRHRRVRILSSDGVDFWSSINFDVEPSFEKLLIHRLRIRRDGQWLDKLHDARIDQLQRGEGLAQGLIDDTRTINVVLADVRVGDELDFAYSLVGANPAFAGHYVETIYVGAGQPVRHHLIRILHPATRHLHYRMTGPKLHYSRTTTAGHVDERWSADNLPEFHVDKNAPASWQPWGTLQISEFADWAEVAHWATGLYATGTIAPGVQALATKLRAQHPQDRDAQLLAALRFVQDDIRYTGIEIGAGSHRPRAPQVVLDTRYGDCKDKVTLLVTLWRALGVKAWPALVSSWQGERVKTLLPSPLAFDHVVAMLPAAGGMLWLDATVNHQRGALDDTAQADFSDALVVRADTTALTPMLTHMPSEPLVDAITTLDLRDSRSGQAKAASMRIHTVYRGVEADRIRASFAGANRTRIGQNYLNYLINYFPGAVQVAAPKIVDDAKANRVEVDERYRLHDLWRDDKEVAGKREAEFWLSVMSSYARLPQSPRRTSPFALGYPSYVRERMLVRLDKGWPLQHDNTDVNDPWFELHANTRLGPDKLQIEATYRAHARSVPAADMQRYTADMRHAREGLSYLLYLQTPAAATTTADHAMASFGKDLAADARWLIILLLVIGLILAAALSGLYRGDLPFLAIWTRPRQVAHAVVERHGLGAAFGLLAVCGFVSGLVPNNERSPWLHHGLVPALFIVVSGACVFAGIQLLFCKLLAWFARLWGARVDAAQIRQITAWTTVMPTVSVIAGLALIAMYGSHAGITPHGSSAVLSMMLTGFLKIVFAVWALVCFVRMLSELGQVGTGRAVAIVFVYTGCVVVLAVLLVIGVRAVFVD